MNYKLTKEELAKRNGSSESNPYEITEDFLKEAMKDPRTRHDMKYDAVKKTKKGSPEYNKAMLEYLKERDIFQQEQGADALKEYPLSAL